MMYNNNEIMLMLNVLVCSCFLSLVYWIRCEGNDVVQFQLFYREPPIVHHLLN